MEHRRRAGGRLGIDQPVGLGPVIAELEVEGRGFGPRRRRTGPDVDGDGPAIADGRRSAADIHRALAGEEAAREEPGQMVTLRQFHRLDDIYDSYDRIDPPTLETGRRVGLSEVEIGFDALSARAEASRCLRCFANIQLDVEKCVLCALCADVCPVDVISLVPADEVDERAPAEATALVLDESRCIRCALCIERCPPDALSMGVWTGTGVPACL